MTPGLTLSAPASWMPAQAHWQNYFVERIGAQLDWALEYVQKQQTQPQELAAHSRSLFTILEQARRHPQWHEKFAAVLVVLGNKPARWGEWGHWETLLQFGLQITAPRSDLAKYHLSLLNEWASLCFATGRLVHAVEISQQVLQQAPTLMTVSGTLILARALDLCLDILIPQGELTAAADWLAQSEAWLSIAAPMAQAYWYMGQAKLARKQRLFSTARDWIQKALTLLEHPPRDAQQLGAAYNLLGVIHWNQEDYPAAVTALQQATYWYLEAGDAVTATSVQGNLGLVYWSMNKFQWAETVVRRAIAMSETLGAHWRLMIDIETLGATYLAYGKPQMALDCFEKQLQLALQLGAQANQFQAHGNRGLALTALGQCGEALKELEIEFRFREVHGGELNLLCNALAMARCLAELNHQAEALALTQQMLTRARTIGHQGAIIASLRCLAQQIPKGQRTSLLQEALSLAQQNNHKLDEAACWLSLAEIATGQERQTYWRRGKRILKDIGALAWLIDHIPSTPPYILCLF